MEHSVKDNMTLLCRKYFPKELSAASNTKLPIGFTDSVYSDE